MPEKKQGDQTIQDALNQLINDVADSKNYVILVATLEKQNNKAGVRTLSKSNFNTQTGKIIEMHIELNKLHKDHQKWFTKSIE